MAPHENVARGCKHKESAPMEAMEATGRERNGAKKREGGIKLHSIHKAPPARTVSSPALNEGMPYKVHFCLQVLAFRPSTPTANASASPAHAGAVTPAFNLTRIVYVVPPVAMKGEPKMYWLAATWEFPCLYPRVLAWLSAGV